MTRLKLPIGIQTFRTIREENHYYVDKTAFIQKLLDEGKHYFLSRPRRFGKSLFLDTLKEAFEGNEPLFAGLHIHRRWDWSARYPVLRLSFGGGDFKEPGHLRKNLMAQFDAIGEESGVAPRYDTAPELPGLETAVEDHAGGGRLDMSVRFKGNVYLFEFKVVESTPAGKAMEQLRAKRYADKYRDLERPIYLIAVEFSKDERNLVAMEVARA